MLCRRSLRPRARARRSAVDRALGEDVELPVGSLLLFEIGIEQAYDIVVAKLFSPGDQGAVSGNLIMLDSLGATDNCCVKHLLVVDLTGYLVGLLDQAIDGGAINAFWRLPKLLEHLLESRDLVFSLTQMIAQTRGELAVGGLIDQLWQ